MMMLCREPQKQYTFYHLRNLFVETTETIHCCLLLWMEMDQMDIDYFYTDFQKF